MGKRLAIFKKYAIIRRQLDLLEFRIGESSGGVCFSDGLKPEGSGTVRGLLFLIKTSHE